MPGKRPGSSYQHASEIRGDLERLKRDPAALMDGPSPFLK